MLVDVVQDADTLASQGWTALAGYDWPTARARFETALADGERPDALDGLGQALYWLGHYGRAVEARERAYALYQGRGDRRPAAAIAVQLAMLHGLLYGNKAAVSGWVRHAERNLQGSEDSAEQGWLELFLGGISHDPDERERRARKALSLARATGDVGLEYDAMGHLGKAMVERGTVAEGMALIDEAVAATTSGLVVDPWAAGEIYCSLFHACEIAIDVRRAQGWLDAVARYVERTRELPVSGICLMHYGGVLKAAGDWKGAERELLAAISIYDGTYRGARFEPALRLADLRARQGRLEEAQQLLNGYEDHPSAAEPRARIHLAREEPRLAATVLERHLDRRGRGLASAPVLALLVEARLADGDVQRARACVEELARLPASEQTSVRGLALLCRARIAAAGGEPGSTALFEEALAAFAHAGLTYELARTRLELARSLIGTRPDIARAEAAVAAASFREIGADRDADATRNLLRRLGDRRESRRQGAGALTPRETDVLDLVAAGLSNGDIAQRLFISPRTAEHHVSNILAKLGLANRAEAAAYAVRAAGGSRDPT